MQPGSTRSRSQLRSRPGVEARHRVHPGGPGIVDEPAEVGLPPPEAAGSTPSGRTALIRTACGPSSSARSRTRRSTAAFATANTPHRRRATRWRRAKRAARSIPPSPCVTICSRCGRGDGPRRGEVHRQAPLPGLVGDVEQRTAAEIRTEPALDVGDEVEPAERVDGCAHRGSAAAGLGHVDVDGDGDAAGGAHRFDDGVQLLPACARRVHRASRPGPCRRRARRRPPGRRAARRSALARPIPGGQAAPTTSATPADPGPRPVVSSCQRLQEPAGGGAGAGAGIGERARGERGVEHLDAESAPPDGCGARHR